MDTTTELTTPTLLNLAARINEHHAACEQAMNTGLQHALEVGRLLVEAKAQVPHGEWAEWVAENFDGADRTERLYRNLYNRRDELEQSGNGVASLSLRSAAKLPCVFPKVAVCSV